MKLDGLSGHGNADAKPESGNGKDASHLQAGLPTPVGPPAPAAVRVPDATGMGARDAVRAIGNAGLVPLVEGTGRLVKQVPSPGMPAPKGSSVRLVFEPAS
jgi:cell division protein FtsI (penicillin-binding protein 3)